MSKQKPKCVGGRKDYPKRHKRAKDNKLLLYEVKDDE